MGQAVHDRAHAVLADTEVDIAADGAGRKGVLFFQGCIVGWPEIGRTTNQKWQLSRQGIQSFTAGLAGSQFLSGIELGQFIPAFRQLSGCSLLPGKQVGVAAQLFSIVFLPGRFLLCAASDRLAHMGANILRDDKSRFRIAAEKLFGQFQLICAKGGAVGIVSVLLVGRAKADVRAGNDQ